MHVSLVRDMQVELNEIWFISNTPVSLKQFVLQCIRIPKEVTKYNNIPRQLSTSDLHICTKIPANTYLRMSVGDLKLKVFHIITNV